MACLEALRRGAGLGAPKNGRRSLTYATREVGSIATSIMLRWRAGRDRMHPSARVSGAHSRADRVEMWIDWIDG